MPADPLSNRKIETGALFQDLLISVTNFFRDGAAFAALDAVGMDHVFANAEAGSIRIWVAGCATGEEAYNIARACIARLGDSASRRGRLLASDISTRALEAARKDAQLVLSRDAALTSERGRALRHLLYLFDRDEAIRLLRAG